MKKSKILVLALTLMLLVGVVFATVVSAYTHANSASGKALAADSWIAAPEKALVKCQGGDCDHTGCDYVYSFAIVGDTQNLNYIDAQNYTAAKAENSALTYADFTSAHMRTLYNWILNNKDSKNIQYVLGLGDITQSFKTTQTYYNDEWPLAKEALSLLDGALGYSLVRGNHDISSGLNAQFGVGTAYYNTLMALAEKNDAEGRPMAAFRDANKIEDSYRKIVTTNGDKYIIYTLEYYPTEETVAWLNETLSANSDYDAIITLHSFLNRDATFVNEFETTTPAEDAVNNNWKETATGGNVEPKELWARSLSKHANVKFIFSGHVDVEDVIVNQLQGENGNTVTCMLIDCQTIDNKKDAENNSDPAGVVTMLYVNADGTVVNVEHISTVRAAAGKDAYLKAQNQFKLTVDYGTAWTETKYGKAPTAEYDAAIFNVFIDDDTDPSTENLYFGGYNTWNDALAAIHVWNGIGGAEARAMKTYNILLNDDYTHSAGIPSKTSGSNPGNFNLDLNGKTMTLSDDGVLVPYYVATTYNTPSFTVQNGDIVMAGTEGSPMVALQCGEKSGGSYKVTLKDLDITYTSTTAGSIVGMYPGNAGYKSYMKVNVTDCNIDASAVETSATLFALNDTNDNLDTTLVISGGSIKGSTSANLKISTLNNGDSVSFASDAGGNYTPIVLNESVAPTGVYRNEKGQLLGFATESTSAPYTFNAYIALVEETPYGLIPTDVYPKESYPFVLFQNGEIVAAYATWKDFNSNIYKVNTKESNNTVLYVRDDVSVPYATYNQFRNVRYLTVDLNGHNITSEAVLFNLVCSENYKFTTNITVINGTLTAARDWAPIVAFNSGNTEDYECKFNITFNGVTLNAAEDFEGRILAEAWANGAYGSKNTITLNNCVIDATVGTVSKVFQLEEKNEQNKIDVAIVINGGKLIANKYVPLGTFSAEREEGKGSPDSLTLSSDFVLQMPSSVAHPTSGITTTAGVLNPIEMADDGTVSTYYFKSIVTKYGTIKNDYLSAVDYPFIIFKNGKYYSAGSEWNAAASGTSGVIPTAVKAASATTDVVTVLLRRDVDHHASKTANTFNTLKGVLNVDFGGYTLTTDREIFQINQKNTNDKIRLNFYNGSVIVTSRRLGAISNQHETAGTRQDLIFTFTDMYLGYKSVNGSTQYGDMINQNEGKSTTEFFCSADVIFDNCTIDLTGHTNTSTAEFAFYSAAADVDTGKHAAHVVFKGGEIRMNNNHTYILASRKTGYPDGEADTVVFEKDSNGSYTKFVMISTENVPSNVYDTEGVGIVKISENDSTAVYQVCDFVKTEYGYIPLEYTDAEKYPILIFKNGSVVATESLLSAAYTKAHAQVQGSATDVVTIYLQKDMTEVLSASFSNTEKIKGTLVIDLGGNTYTTSAKALFQINSKDVSNTPKIEIRNGRLNTVRLFALANQTTARCQHYDITFKNVTLGLTENHWNDMISTNATAKSAGYYSYVNITFEDCIFDLVTNQLLASYRLMDLANDDDNHAVNVVFKGGEIIYGNVNLTLASIKSGYSDNTHFVTGASDSDTVKFEKGANGYTVFKGATAPTNVYDSTELAFVKTADNGTYATYTLKLAALVDFNFTPKTSITLSNALVYNVYVPVNAALKSFTLNGVTYIDIASL